MLFRGRFHALCVALLIGVGVVVPQQVASAATTVPVSCTEGSITLYGAVGDQIDLSLASSCSGWELSNSLNINSGLPRGWLQRVSVTPSGAPSYNNGTSTNWWYLGSNGTPFVVRVQIMATNASGTPISEGSQIAVLGDGTTNIFFIYGGAPSASPDGGTPPVLQGVPLPASGTCSDVADAHLSWGTGLTGGWVRAWQPWAGAMSVGGWACVRTLVNRGGFVWQVDNATG